ncbi:hypothetical protein EVAR_47683_1 [Eumeta japonica]|uniref:Uncharacterized protein n=1 Tax=Eumeta variegata TaxID=151549 RepID=A0A4C1XQZ9_EUMVA|nr:hypothetical protein EVAR_47683_1 [Eumeta japonica]
MTQVGGVYLFIWRVSDGLRTVRGAPLTNQPLRRMRLILAIVLIDCLACRVEPKGGFGSLLRGVAKTTRAASDVAGFFDNNLGIFLTVFVVALLIGLCSILAKYACVEGDAKDEDVEAENQETRSIEM